MDLYFLLAAGPTASGLILAVVAVAVGWRRRTPITGSARILPGVVLSGALACMALGFAALLPLWRQDADGGPPQVIRFLTPLVLGGLLVVAYAVPLPPRAPSGAATLEPRSLFSYAPVRWLWLAAGLVVIAVVAAIMAGGASSLDAQGRFTQYKVHAGSGAAATGIYGWYFSGPSLIALAVLVALVPLGLACITHVRFGGDLEGERYSRLARARGVVTAAVGAMAMHLGMVLRSLGATAGLRLEIPGEGGRIEVVPPFAALGPALTVLGYVAIVLGLALWWWLLLSLIVAPARVVHAARA